MKQIGAQMKQAGVITAYLAAVVAANLTVSVFGPTASIVNAFLFIALPLATRDYLHELWGSKRWRNMGLLIVGGSALSYGASLFFADSALPSEVVAKIALASTAAFAVAEAFDAITYHGLKVRGWEWLERANTSNIVGAGLDSVVFVSIAFGFSWEIAFAQFCAKVAGGFIWSMLLKQAIDKVEPSWG